MAEFQSGGFGVEWKRAGKSAGSKMDGGYYNRPLDSLLRWVLISIALVIVDFFCCLGLQAIVDHGLNVENYFIAPVVSHLLSGAGLLLIVRRWARVGRKKHLLTIVLAWITTSPVALLISLGINFAYRFTF